MCSTPSYLHMSWNKILNKSASFCSTQVSLEMLKQKPLLLRGPASTHDSVLLSDYNKKLTQGATFEFHCSSETRIFIFILASAEGTQEQLKVSKCISCSPTLHGDFLKICTRRSKRHRKAINTGWWAKVHMCWQLSFSNVYIVKKRNFLVPQNTESECNDGLIWEKSLQITTSREQWVNMTSEPNVSMTQIKNLSQKGWEVHSSGSGMKR